MKLMRLLLVNSVMIIIIIIIMINQDKPIPDKNTIGYDSKAIRNISIKR